MTPSKPLTPTELDELRAWHVDDEGHRARKPECLVCRLFATLDATQAVEPGLREALREQMERRNENLDRTNPGESYRDPDDMELTFYLRAGDVRAALAARSSSAPAE